MDLRGLDQTSIRRNLHCAIMFIDQSLFNQITDIKIQKDHIALVCLHPGIVIGKGGKTIASLSRTFNKYMGTTDVALTIEENSLWHDLYNQQKNLRGIRGITNSFLLYPKLKNKIYGGIMLRTVAATTICVGGNKLLTRVQIGTESICFYTDGSGQYFIRGEYLETFSASVGEKLFKNLSLDVRGLIHDTKPTPGCIPLYMYDHGVLRCLGTVDALDDELSYAFTDGRSY